MRIPDGYELLTVENARVGLTFYTVDYTPYVIDRITAGGFVITLGSRRFSLATPNKLIKVESAIAAEPVTAIKPSKYIYCLNPNITSLPGNFNVAMSYMLTPGWEYHSDKELDLTSNVELSNENKGYDTRFWTLRPGQLILKSTNQEVLSTPKPVWSNPRSIKINFIKDYLVEQIRVRYANIERPRSGKRNQVIDTYMPRVFANNNMYTAHFKNYAGFPATSFTISPWYGDMLNIPVIPASDLCRVLGYSTKKLKTLISAVKQKKITMAFIGYGGTNINTIYWLSEILKFTGSINLFERVYLYEREDVETSNLLRFPKNPLLARANYGAKKLALLKDELELMSKHTPSVIEGYFTKTDRYVLNAPNTFRSPNTVMYGAPGINTRIELSEIGNFISATHGSTECSLHINPAQDAELQVESYGVIQLNSFFMNQIRMAIGLLEILASDQDLSEKNKEYLTYSFDGVPKLKTVNTYDFNITSSDVLDAPEAAANQPEEDFPPF